MHSWACGKDIIVQNTWDCLFSPVFCIQMLVTSPITLQYSGRDRRPSLASTIDDLTPPVAAPALRNSSCATTNSHTGAPVLPDALINSSCATTNSHTIAPVLPEACYIRVPLNLTNCMCTLLHLLERMWRRSRHQAYIDFRNKTITAAAQRRITIKWLIKVKNNISQF